jgi:hypothetical protein
MDAALRARAEERLLQATTLLGLADPRPRLRERLRSLRASHPDAFEGAVAHYEHGVLPRLADADGTDDVLAAWTEYGTFLAGQTANCRLLRVDGTGRSTPFRPTAAAGELVLAVPDDLAIDVLVLLEPARATPAQAAALSLLVERRLGTS